MCQRIDTCIRIVGCVIGSIEQFTVFVLYLILSMPFVYGTSHHREHRVPLNSYYYFLSSLFLLSPYHSTTLSIILFHLK